MLRNERVNIFYISSGGDRYYYIIFWSRRIVKIKRVDEVPVVVSLS